jgi:hypothetical protein
MAEMSRADQRRYHETKLAEIDAAEQTLAELSRLQSLTLKEKSELDGVRTYRAREDKLIAANAITLAEQDRDLHAQQEQGRRLADEVERLTEAIATGAASAALGGAVATRERQRADVLARLEHLNGLSRAPEWGDGIRDKLRARLIEWHGFLGRQPEIARQILRKLLVGRLVLTPNPEARTYAVQGRVTYGRLLEGIVSVVGVVPPGGSDAPYTVEIRAVLAAA